MKLVDLETLPRQQPEEIEIPPDGLSIDLLRAVYRANHLPLHTRMRAAMAALKHEVPSLGVSVVVNDADIATRLDKAIARCQEMKLIEARPPPDKLIEAQPIAEPRSKPTPAPLSRLYNNRLYRRI